MLDGGRLVETGTHENLLRSSGLYARLAAMQFGLGAGSDDSQNQTVNA